MKYRIVSVLCLLPLFACTEEAGSHSSLETIEEAVVVESLSPPTPPPPTPPPTTPTTATEPQPIEKEDECDNCGISNYDFVLESGDAAVCSAYVEHLNSTKMRHPFCDMQRERPSHGIVPEQRIELSNQHLAQLVVESKAFLGTIIDADEIEQNTQSVEKYEQYLERWRPSARDGWLHRIDINGDGKEETLFVFLEGPCWYDQEHRQVARAYVLDESQMQIDLQLTRQYYFNKSPEANSQLSSNYRYNHRSIQTHRETSYFRFNSGTYMVGTGTAGTRYDLTLDLTVYEIEPQGFKSQCEITWSENNQ